MDMSETMLTIEEAARRLPELVEQVHARREAAVLLKSGKPVVRIVPVPALGEEAEDLIGFLRQWRIEHPDADEQFAEAIEESRRAVRPPQNPWV